MQLSLYQASFCVVALCALICKAYGTDDRTALQGEVRKRIFCNFYGCGSKRSGVDEISDDVGNLVDDDMSTYTEHSSPHDELTEAREAAAIMGAQRILRAAALWEAMKERVHKDRPRKLFKRNSS